MGLMELEINRSFARPTIMLPSPGPDVFTALVATSNSFICQDAVYFWRLQTGTASAAIPYEALDEPGYPIFRGSCQKTINRHAPPPARPVDEMVKSRNLSLPFSSSHVLIGC